MSHCKPPAASKPTATSTPAPAPTPANADFNAPACNLLLKNFPILFRKFFKSFYFIPKANHLAPSLPEHYPYHNYNYDHFGPHHPFVGGPTKPTIITNNQNNNINF